MEPLELLLVGCGMMGARHMRGVGELASVAPDMLRLAAVCDTRQEYADRVADEAEGLLGQRPAVYTDLDQALREQPQASLVDLVTDPRSHDDLTVKLLEDGRHVLCEKPLALTIARGRRMVEAAAATGRVLATAENNRRDPMMRLAQATVDSGLLGQPNFIMHTIINPGNRVIGTAWRHRRAMGGVLFDVGIHNTYEMEMLLGPLAAVCGQSQQITQSFSGKEFDGREVEVTVDAEDCFAALLSFASGCQGQYTVHFASAGDGFGKRLLLGELGTMEGPFPRSGASPSVRLGAESLSGEALVERLPDYRLNDLEAALFGQRCAGYQWEYPMTDRKLIAAELGDFVQAVRTGRRPESDGATGLRAVGIVWAIMESALARRPVTLEEVLSGELHVYQDTVEAAS